MVTVKTSETRFREIDGVTQKLDLVELWGLTSDVPNLPTEGIENMSLFIEAKEDDGLFPWTFDLETKTWKKNYREE